MGDFWREVNCELVSAINASGLYDASTSCNMVFVGRGETRYLTGRGMPKWDTHEFAGEVWEYEYPTLRLAYKQSLADPCSKILYMHTKGVSSPYAGGTAYEGRRFRGYWRQVMTYHVVNRWRECVGLLDEYDAVGPFQVPPPRPHFGGNFWWARGEHLARLGEPNPDFNDLHPRLFAELWIQSQPCRTFDLYPWPPSPGDAFCQDEYRLTGAQR